MAEPKEPTHDPIARPVIDPDYETYLSDRMGNLLGNNQQGLLNGLQPKNIADWLLDCRYAPPVVKACINGAGTSYDLGFKPQFGYSFMLQQKYAPVDFQGKTTYVWDLEENQYIDSVTGIVTDSTPPNNPEGETQIGTTQCNFVIPESVGVAANNDLMDRGFAWMQESDRNTTHGMIAAYSMYNQGWLLQHQGRDSLITLLSVWPEFLTRLSSVIAVGNRAHEWCVKRSAGTGMLYGLRDLCSKMPVDLDTKIWLMSDPTAQQHIFPNIPTYLETLWLLMSNGVEPMGLVSPTNVDILPATTPEWITGHPKTSEVGVSNSFHEYVNWCFAASIGCYRALARHPAIIVSVNYPPMDRHDGKTYGTLFGSLLKSALTSTGIYGYPQITNDGDWGDLKAWVGSDDLRRKQVWNMVNDGLMLDPVARDVLKNDNATREHFVQEPNGQFLLDVYYSS